MKKHLLAIPFVLFLFILLTFSYLLTIERNPSELPSNLLNKKVPSFEAESLFSNKKFVSSEEFGNDIIPTLLAYDIIKDMIEFEYIIKLHTKK